MSEDKPASRSNGNIRATSVDREYSENDKFATNTQSLGIISRYVWPFFSIVLYVAFVLAAVVFIFVGLEMLGYYSLRRTYLTDVYPKDFSLVKRNNTRAMTHYDYDFEPRVCLNYYTLKGNRFEYANNAGFREPRDISLNKPADEYRVFLTGGSTAFGHGTSDEVVAIRGPYSLEYRETISHIMEKILNASAPIEGKTIRVYNAAVWGHAYQHDLIRYLAKLRQYNPDLVVSLDGANEIPLICELKPDWNYFKVGQYDNILRQFFNYDNTGLASYLTLWIKNNSYLATRLWLDRDLVHEISEETWKRAQSKSGPKITKQGAGPSVEQMSRMVDHNVATVVRMVENYHSVLANDSVPHIFALQPWLYLSNKPLHPNEQVVSKMEGKRHFMGIPSDKIYELLIARIMESAVQKDYHVVNFSQYFDDVQEWVFSDWCHLTAGANYLIAKELSNQVKEYVFKHPLSESDRIANKNSYFWDLAYSSKVDYSPPPESESTGPRNILSGYPGERVYASKAVPTNNRLEIILDFDRPYMISRIRIVWADETAVPEESVVETSLDGKTWRPFATMKKDQTDNYSRWPGYEHYAAEQTSARYVRYKPTKTSERSIRLRSWTIYK